jgi:hypothetical protein
MVVAAGLPDFLWPEVHKAAGYILNRTPHKQLDWQTPMGVMRKEKPRIGHLRRYGCRAYALRHGVPKKDKLQPRAHIGYLVGYDSTNIFRIWIPSLERVIRTRDVIFDEETLYNPADIDWSQLHELEKVEDLVEVIYPSRASREPMEEDTIIVD